jgi:GPN-loop GTPase
MVAFLPLDVTDEDSLGAVLSHIDHALCAASQIVRGNSFGRAHRQYGESEEPKEPKDLDEGDFDMGE